MTAQVLHWICLWNERALAVVVLPCVPVCLSYIDGQYCLPLKNVGTTEQQSKENFIAWINAMVRNNCTKVKISRDNNGDELEGCFEGMSCSDLQKVIAAFNELHEWRAACTGNSVSAGRFLAITGNESKMSITRHRLGPFCWTNYIVYELLSYYWTMMNDEFYFKKNMLVLK